MKVSVVTPSYNQGRFLAQAIEIGPERVGPEQLGIARIDVAEGSAHVDGVGGRGARRRGSQRDRRQVEGGLLIDDDPLDARMAGRTSRALPPLTPWSSNTATTFQPCRSATACSSRIWFSVV